jgi:SAM-dependent methyltransferase
MTYDPVTYWRERGKQYEAKFVRSPKFAVQEAAILGLLARLKFTSVLEIGCGFGRIGSLIVAARPDISYVGVEVSPDMIASAQQKMPKAELCEATLDDFDPAGRQWDLVIAVETLMHLRPGAEITAAVAKMRDLSKRHIVTLDWSYPLAPTVKIAEHNFLHDYRELFGPKATATPLDQQAMWYMRRDFGRW